MKETREGWVPLDVAATEAFLRHILGGTSETDQQDTIPRPINTTPLFPLKQIWPEVVERLATLLVQTGEAALAEAVRELDVFDRCRCGADYCATVHTQPRSAERFGPNHRCVVFWSPDTICVDTGLPASSDGRPTAPHITIMDVVDEEIACIEILDDAAEPVSPVDCLAGRILISTSTRSPFSPGRTAKIPTTGRTPALPPLIGVKIGLPK